MCKLKKKIGFDILIVGTNAVSNWEGGRKDMGNAGKIRALVIGYGNVGRYALEALKGEKDFAVVGIVDPYWAESMREADGVPLVKSAQDAPDFDVALLCVPTRKVLETGLSVLKMGKRTADIFDIHGEELLNVYRQFDAAAKANNTAALLSAGWDPGIDSVFRTLLSVMIPHGITYTNFGPGMSMGHSVAVKAVPGVRDAVSLTYPRGSGMHRRLVYILAKPDADRAAIEKAVRADPYFVRDEVAVFFVDSLDDARDFGHGVEIERKGRAGLHYNQRASFSAQINNPAVTSQVLVMAARAVMKQRPGAYTMSQVPPADFLDMPVEQIVLQMT